MTTDSKWTDWIPHVAGDPCPIPTAKAGDFWFRTQDGEEQHIKSENGDYWNWSHGPDGPVEGRKITHYRIRLPSPDWKGIAEELAAALDWMVENDETNEGDEEMPERGNATWNEINKYWIDGLNRSRAALTRYREAAQ